MSQKRKRKTRCGSASVAEAKTMANKIVKLKKHCGNTIKKHKPDYAAMIRYNELTDKKYYHIPDEVRTKLKAKK
jgi:hypothetical protein